MLLHRICLVLTILAGLGVIAVCQFKVRPHVEGIIAERELNKKNWKTQEARANKLDKDLAATRSTLEDTRTKLSEAEQQRDAARTQFAAEQKRANGLSKKLDDTSAELKTSKQELQAWLGTGLTPDQVKGVKAERDNLEKEVAAVKDENKLLSKKVKDLAAQILALTNPGMDPPLPAGTKGRVLVVDPKWDFVILDLGEKDSLVERGVLMVQRNGKLIAKVRITTIQKDRSVANIVPGWKLEEPMEGDMVFY